MTGKSTFITRLRGWGRRNLIFFEMFEKGLLGVMAAIIGYTQLNTSNKELELHRKELSAVFRVKYTYPYDRSSKKIMDDSLLINVMNLGKEVESFNCDIGAFLKLKINKKNHPDYNFINDEVYIPVSGILDNYEYRNNVSALSIKEKFDLDSIEGHCNRLLGSDEFFITASIVNSFVVSYSDMFNEQNEDYFIDTKKVSYEDFFGTLKVDNRSFKSKIKIDNIPKTIIKFFIEESNFPKGGDGPESAGGGG